MNSAPLPWNFWKWKTTTWIHVPANLMEGTSVIGFHIQLEMSHWDLPSIGEGCRIAKFILTIQLFQINSAPPPYPHERHFWNWGVKTTAGIHVPGKPKEGTSGIGFHIQLVEMTYLDIPSILGAEFAWNSPFPSMLLCHPCVIFSLIWYKSFNMIYVFHVFFYSSLVASLLNSVCLLSWIHAL